MASRHRIAETINESSMGDVEKYFEQLSTMIDSNSGVNDFKIISSDCHAQSAPLYADGFTKFNLTETAVDIVDLTFGRPGGSFFQPIFPRKEKNCRVSQGFLFHGQIYWKKTNFFLFSMKIFQNLWTKKPFRARKDLEISFFHFSNSTNINRKIFLREKAQNFGEKGW